PRQGARPDDEARPRAVPLRLRRLVRRGSRARGLRAADPRRAHGRPHAVHARRRDRAAVGRLRAAARRPRPGLSVREGVVGPGRRARADRPGRLAPAGEGVMRPVNGHGPVAVVFDIDGTLITTGGAGAVAWRRAFEDLYGIPADIGASSDAGMTDPEVGLRTFVDALGRQPRNGELERVLERRLAYLPWAVAQSEGYRVLAGVRELLPRLAEAGYLLGLTTGGVEPAARVKLGRAGLNRYFGFGGFGSDSTDRTELTRRAIERAAEAHGGGVDPSRCLVVGDTPLD